MNQAAQTKIRTCPRPNCILCDLKGEVLYEGLVDALFDAPGVWTLKQCPAEQCRTAWLDPAPHADDLHIAYQTYYTHDSSGDTGFLTRLRAFLFGCYKAVKYVPALLVGLEKSRERIYYRFLQGLKPGKLLDIGCGDGGFLNLMKGLGWSVAGLDFDAQAIASAKNKYGLTLLQSDLKGARFPSDTFDAITLSHVIEHVPDPVELMAEIRRVLKTGGRFTLMTPNIRSLGHKKFKKDWRGLEPPRHLNIFSVQALRECAQRAGLEVLEASSTAAHADIITGGSYAIRHFNQQRDAHAPRPQINIFRAINSLLFQYREYFSLRADPDAGEEVVLICTKKST